MKKVTEKELQTLKSLVSGINEGQATIGGLEMQKISVISMVSQARDELNKVQEDLKKIYGDVNINLATGEITDASNPED